MEPGLAWSYQPGLHKCACLFRANQPACSTSGIAHLQASSERQHKHRGFGGEWPYVCVYDKICIYKIVCIKKQIEYNTIKYNVIWYNIIN